MASSLKDYLKRYTSSGDDGGKVKSKKKRKGAASNKVVQTGVVIVDHDMDWKKDRMYEAEEDLEELCDGPLVIEDVEVKRMHRMETVKFHRPYLTVANDGSGWVAIRDEELGEKIANIGNSLLPAVVDVLPFRGRVNSQVGSPSRESEDLQDSAGRDPSVLRKGNDSEHRSSPRRNNSEPTSAFVETATPDFSPPRRKQETSEGRLRSNDTVAGGSPDLSPPRRKQETSEGRLRSNDTVAGGSPDLSPPRKRQENAEGKFRRKTIRADGSIATIRSGQDVSPSHGRENSLAGLPSHGIEELQKSRGRNPVMLGKGKDSQDISPPRRNTSSSKSAHIRESAFSDFSPPRRNQQNPEGKLQRKDTMADGSIAGLKSGKEVQQYAERKRKMEAQKISELDPSMSGRDAGTVYRDKRGRRLEGLEELLRQQRGDVKPVEEPLEWGKGLAQKKQNQAQLEEIEEQKNKPFARSRDDPELDKIFRERIRWGDPMAHLVKKKSEPVLEDLGAREEMKASGFIVPQDIPSHSWLKRGIPPPLNRYGIKPGRHWDGVDRSTGFEKEMFKQKNEKQALDREAYLWSVADM